MVEANAENEGKRWACPKCGGTISCHNGVCFQCRLDELKSKKGGTDGRTTKIRQNHFSLRIRGCSGFNGIVDLPTLKRTNTSMKPE